MTTTQAAGPATGAAGGDATGGALGPAGRATGWQTARAIARVEAKHRLRAALVPAGLALFMSIGGRGNVVDMRAWSYNAAFAWLLLAAVVLVSSHRAVTRPRREGAEEMVTATPAPARAVTAGHLLAVLAPTALTAVVTSVVTVLVMRWSTTIGDPVVAELAVAPALVAGAGCLGVLLARTWPQRFTPFLACLGVAVFELAVNTPRLAGSGFRWLVFWVEGSLWWLLPRHTGAHLAYLVGLVAMAAAGALLRHGTTRRLVAAGAGAVAITVLGAGLQMRQPQDHWRRADAMFAAPASVQTCTTRAGVRYCAFEGFEDMIGEFIAMVERVRSVTPPQRWPGGLAVTQRVTALDLQYSGDGSKWLPHVPSMPSGAVRQPDDGEIHPGLEFGWSPPQQLGLGLQVAARALGLPVVPDPKDGQVCVAAGQARAVVALWLGAHAERDRGDGLAWVVERAEADVAAGGRPGRDAVTPIAEVDVYGGFAVSLDDARLALDLLRRPSATVAEVVGREWPRLSDPTTPSGDLAALFAVAGAGRAGAPQSPFVARPGPDQGGSAPAVTLGPQCR